MDNGSYVEAKVICLFLSYFSALELKERLSLYFKFIIFNIEFSYNSRLSGAVFPPYFIVLYTTDTSLQMSI